MFLGICWLLPNPPGPSSQPWRTATGREAAPGRSGAHSFLIIQLLWSPRSSSAPQDSRSTGLGLSMFNGSKGLIWTPKPFRLLQHKGLRCGMAADGRLGVAPRSAEWRGMIRVQRVTGALGNTTTETEGPASLRQGSSHTLTAPPWSRLQMPIAHTVRVLVGHPRRKEMIGWMRPLV